jgi:hypothetical protein
MGDHKMRISTLAVGIVLGGTSVVASPTVVPKVASVLHDLLDRVVWSQESCREAVASCEAAAAHQLAERVDESSRNRTRLVTEIAVLDSHVAVVQRSLAGARSLITEANHLLADPFSGDVVLFAGNRMDRQELSLQVQSLRGEIATLEVALERFAHLRAELSGSVEHLAAQDTQLRLLAAELPAKAQLEQVRATADTSTLMASYFDTPHAIATGGPLTLAELLRNSDSHP